MNLQMTYEQYLDKVIDTLFSEAYERYTWEEWAAEAGVSSTTVNRLGMRITKRPQLRTIMLLAQAVNIDLPTIKNLQKLRKAA